MKRSPRKKSLYNNLNLYREELLRQLTDEKENFLLKEEVADKIVGLDRLAILFQPNPSHRPLSPPLQRKRKSQLKGEFVWALLYLTIPVMSALQ